MNESLKTKDFYGHDFVVSPDVLIPRPETEQIIDEVLSLSGKPFLPGIKPTKRVLKEHPTVLDVGTGSGCIAITLSLLLNDTTIIACDISKPALDIAKQNAKRLKAKVNFIESDLLQNITITPDLIVANLPYVDKDWPWIDKEQLSKEPSVALYAKDHGLAIIKKLILEASARKVKYLILEADPCQHESILNFAKENGFALSKAIGFILSLIYSE